MDLEVYGLRGSKSKSMQVKRVWGSMSVILGVRMFGGLIIYWLSGHGVWWVYLFNFEIVDQFLVLVSSGC